MVKYRVSAKFKINNHVVPDKYVSISRNCCLLAAHLFQKSSVFFYLLNYNVIDWAAANIINRKLKISQVQIPSSAVVSPVADKVISCFLRNPTVYYRFVPNQAKLLNTCFIKMCLKLSDYLRLVLKQVLHDIQLKSCTNLSVCNTLHIPPQRFCLV